jgi:phage-related protein
MAQQITIDIVAETKKLTQGVNDVNGQLQGLTGGISKAQQAAVGLASAFILSKGVTFAKKASEEFMDAEKTAKLAAVAFGKGSDALDKITTDADKFSKSLAVDNDDLIKLATTLSVNLPTAAKGSSTELVNLGYDVAALKGIDIESWTNKFSKAMVDGSLSVKEMQTLVPQLSDATYAQADALFKAGKEQDAMNLLMKEAQKKYGDAAESQVTGTQRMNKALGDLYETIGKSVAPIIEKLAKFLADVVDWVVQNQSVIVPLVAVLGTFAAGILALNAGLTAYNSIMAAWKVATTIATTAQGLFNAVMAANPIGLVVLAIIALIAIIVLLVKNWDTVTEVVGKVWNTIKDFAKNAWDAISGFVKSAIEAFGSFLGKVGGFVEDVVKAIFAIPGKLIQVGKDMVTSIWDGVSGSISWLASKIGGIASTIASNLKEGIGSFISIGENILTGLITGITNKVSAVVNAVKNAVSSVINGAKSILGIKSPSKVFASIGKNVVLGMAEGIDNTKAVLGSSITSMGNLAVNSINTPVGAGIGGINITINAGLGTDPYTLGREVNKAISTYGKVSSRTVYGR